MRAVALIALLLAVVLLAPSVSALTEQEAAKIFQRGGCTGCHNGAVAPKFEDTVKMFREWASRYTSIDEAVKTESKKFKPPAHPYNSYDELMKHMRQLAPGISDEDFKALYEFYKMVFEEARKGAGGAAAPAGISLEDAKKAFQPCIGCHNGAVAPKLEEIVEMFRDWASKYASIDEAVKAESKKFKPPAHPYNSYDELMKHMRQLAPGISDKDFELLYKFFEQVFQQAKGGGAGPAGTETATQTETQTATETPAETTTTTVAKPKPTLSVSTPPQVATPNPAEESKTLYSNAAVIGAALLVISVVVAAIAFFRR